ncbi:MAG: C39 family peptidase, partial [Candidatus Cloacimonetes bacterium]|nr:C39 family peptidase [Candidatus Cloacimonadota bacterium]
YSQCLSQEFASGWKAEELAEAHLGKPVELEKMYFINRFDLWYCFQADTEKVYVKLYPPRKICNEDEFRKQTEYTEPFCKRSDHSQSWAEYLSGQKTLTRNEYFIDHHEIVPYYDWSYGCSPTAATMALAYWDNISVINDQNFALLVEYHFQRYDNIQVEWDYQVPDLQRELAIAMETDTLSSGSTAVSNIAPGITIVTDDNYYDFNNYITTTGNLFNSVINQTVLDRPFLVSEPGHSNCGVGYNSDTNHAAVHNTHTSTIDWLSEDLIDAVIIIIPGGGYGKGINLVHPRGDLGYNSDGNGETLLAGAVYEIAWQKDSEYRDQVSIWFSIIGNGGAAQQYVTENAPNNREFDWVVPDWINSTSARIGIGLYDESDSKLGGDSSFGNFIISPGGSIPELNSGNSIVSNREPQYFRFSNFTSTWVVVGVRKMVSSDDEDWNMRLFSDTWFETELIGSFLSSYNPMDFVVIDGRHTPWTERGIKIFRPLGSGEARVEYEGAREDLYYGTNGPFNWTAAEDVVRMWDIALMPGNYYIIMEPNGGGNANLDMAIFGSNDEPYYGNRLDALVASTYLGTDISETIAIEITEPDVYGLCVWANDEYSKNYNIRIEQPGIWRGIVSDYWYDADNWSGGVIPNTSTDIVIPAGTPYDIRLVDSGANCHDMTIMADARVEIYNCWLNVYGDLEVRGELEMTSNQAKMVVDGDIVWQEGAIADIQAGSSEIWVRGDWYFERNSTIHLDLGYVEFDGTGNSEIICRSEDSYFHHLRSDKDSGNWVGNSDNSTYPLVINGNFYNYTDSYFIGWSLNSTIFRGSFNNNAGAQFEYPNGTVRFEGANQHINFNPGDYFNNLIIAGSVFLDSGIIIEEDLVIESGSLVSDSNTIQIVGDWTDEVGFGGFGEGSGVVIFNGNGTQRINGETFATLRINKNNGELRFTSGITYCDELDWLNGTIRVNGGEFTALNINSSSLEHDLTITSGLLEIHKPSGYLDINNVLTIEGGEFHIIGAASSNSYWAWSGPVEFNMSGGILDYHDTGIRICDDYPLEENLTGGIIRTTGDFYCDRNDCYLYCMLELYGESDTEIDIQLGSRVGGLKINKTANRSYGENNSDKIKRLDRISGNIYERNRTQNVTALNPFYIKGDFIITSGNYVAPSYMYVTGNWANYPGLDYFDEGTSLIIFTGDENSQLLTDERFYNVFVDKASSENYSLLLTAGKTHKISNSLEVINGYLEVSEGVSIYLDNFLDIENGGVLELNGIEGNPIKISSSVDRYAFQVLSGGEIGAEYTEFELMDSNGINIMDGASVTVGKAFN